MVYGKLIVQKEDEIKELEVERDRYWDALRLIVENYESMSRWDNQLIIPNLHIAREALG